MKLKHLFYLVTLFTWVALVGCTSTEAVSTVPTAQATVAATAVPTTPPTTEPTAVPTTPPTTEPTAVPTLNLGPNVAADSPGLEAATAAAAALAANPSIDPSQLVVESIVSMTWPDGCLGVHRMGVLCTNIVSDGYVVTFGLNGRYYQTNTNADGTSLVPVPGAVAAPGGVGLTLQTTDTCTDLILSDTQGLQAGPCDGQLTNYPLNSDTAQNLQSPYVDASSYAPFHVQSPIGIINFNGTGNTIADPTVQRQIGEMVKWIGQTAVAGHTDPGQQLALSWHREGGIAGFCDDLAIYSYGKAVGTACQTDANAPVAPNWFGWFSVDQLSQLYDWTAQFANFDYTQSDPASVSDGLAITIHFNGLGFTEASDTDKQAITDFAGGLFAQATAPAVFSCTLKAPADVTIYQRPSLAADPFGTLAAGETVQATMQTSDGWLGFDPGTAQAANVGLFRLRWLEPGAAVPQGSGCDGLSLAAPISPTACYFMAMAETTIYATPSDTATVQYKIAAGEYIAVTGQTSTGWYQLDLQDGSFAQPGTGWLNPTDANSNGVCDSLPPVTP